MFRLVQHTLTALTNRLKGIHIKKGCLYRNIASCLAWPTDVDEKYKSAVSGIFLRA